MTMMEVFQTAVQDHSYAETLSRQPLRPISVSTDTHDLESTKLWFFAIKSEKCRSNLKARLSKMGAPNLSQKPRNSLKKER